MERYPREFPILRSRSQPALRFPPDPFLAMAMAMAMAMAILLISASSSSSSSSYSDTSQVFPSDRSSSPNESPERNELLELQHVILSLEKRVGETDLYASQNDKEIIFLQKEIQQLEQSNGGRLINHKLKIAKEQAMAKELEEILVRRSGEVDDLRRHINMLENTQQQQAFEVEQLEQTSENQRTSMAKLQNVLHVAEESVLRLQQHLKLKEEELDKTYKQWLPPLAVKGCILLIQNIEDLWIYSLKKGKHGILIVSNFMEILRSEGLRHFKELALTHLKEGHNALKDKLEIAIESSRPYMDAFVRFVQLYVDEYEVYFKYIAMQSTSHYGGALKSAVMYHHKLQHKIWIILKRNKYSAVFATSKLIVWLLATGLLLFPLYGAFQLVSVLGFRRRTNRRRGH